MIRSLKNNYYLRRLIILAAIYFGIEVIENIILCILEWKNLNISLLSLGKMIWTMVTETGITFVHGILPYLLFLLILPQSWHKGRLDRIVSTLFFTLFIGLNLFEDISEAFFWNEFSSTFNFIAVDYLIYTKEVIGNINQSYPMALIISGIVSITLFSVWLLRKQIIPVNLAVPRLRTRVTWFASGVLFCILAYQLVDIDDAQNTDNRYANEIAKDGLYSLFSAFLKNELEYNKFYITEDKEKVGKELREELKRENQIYLDETNDSIKRKITPDGQPIPANVIIVIMESMGSEFLNENRTDKANITPNLTALASKGVFFPNTYATGTRSVRGLEAVSVSIPPLPGMSIIRRQGNENIETIGSLFASQGYKNKWIYGGYGYFDNMNYFYEHNGFEVVDRTSLNDDEITHTTVWGVCDEDLFRRTIRECDKSFAQKEPFLNIVFTTSNHRPYTYPDGKIDIPSKTGRLGAVKYADYAIGEFLSMAKTKPWFDDTVFVFIADHGAGSAGKKELNPETHLIPLIIYSPKHIQPERHDSPISQIDTLPTLLGLLNIPYEASFYGKDARRPDYIFRGFISNYQYIGYLKSDNMIVMRPVKSVLYYDKNNKVEAPDSEMKKQLQEAVMYYQHASDWRQHLGRGKADTKDQRAKSSL